MECFVSGCGPSALAGSPPKRMGINDLRFMGRYLDMTPKLPTMSYVIKPFKTLFCILILLVILSMTCRGADFNEFAAALNQVETGGNKSGSLLGDDKKALGPFQIHRAYFIDSRTVESYEQCTNYVFARGVVKNYLARYASAALRKRDWQTCARIHNGGPKGATRSATLIYWHRVKKVLTR